MTRHVSEKAGSRSDPMLLTSDRTGRYEQRACRQRQIPSSLVLPVIVSVPTTSAWRLHAIQGFLVLWLANGFTLPVIATYMAGPPGTAPPEVTPLFEVSVAWGVAIFLFMSAVAHSHRRPGSISGIAKT